MHGKLIDAYVAKCDGDFGSLPNDNYIFWFLGYHLYKADYRHLFPKIYLDLKFILAKLRATGPSDLLNDYRKYVDYISGKVRFRNVVAQGILTSRLSFFSEWRILTACRRLFTVHSNVRPHRCAVSRAGYRTTGTAAAKEQSSLLVCFRDGS